MRRRSAQPHRLIATATALALVLLAGLWAGCSVEKHYNTLSFFFDGVPNPNAPKPEDAAAQNNTPGAPRVARVVLMTHQPFKEKNCIACHATKEGGKVTTLDAAGCYSCHKETEKGDIGKRHKLIHEPVAAGQCLWCHNPHDSSDPHLLRASPHEICSQCHAREVLSRATPAHQEEGRNCLQCHTAHGSDKPMLLKPTTRPM